MAASRYKSKLADETLNMPILSHFRSARRVATLAVALVMVAGQASADDAPLPPNSLPCDAFTKKADGAWVAKRAVSMDVGNAKNLIVDPGEITPKTDVVGGVGLYVLLEAKCGKSPA
jgi:hypothetical protein